MARNKDEDAAFEAGYDAYKLDDAFRDDNPYEQNTIEWKRWDLGWCAGHEIHLEMCGIDTSPIICRYCGGNCPNEPNNSEYLCDGFAGDIDSLYAEDE